MRDRQARMIREGLAENYRKIIGELLARVTVGNPGCGVEKAKPYVDTTRHLDRMLQTLTGIESAIEANRLEEQTPQTVQRLFLLQEKGKKLRDAIVRTSERIILSLSAVASRKRPA